MIDISMYNSFGTESKNGVEPDCAEYTEFWDNWLKIAHRPLDFLIRYCRDFILSCENKISTETDNKRIEAIRGTIAQARAFLGVNLGSAGDILSEREMVQAINEARQAGYAQVTFNTIQTLAIYYTSVGRYDDALTAHMMTTQFVAELGTPMLWLLIDRVAHLLSQRNSVDASVQLYEWLSVFHNSPLQALKNRAGRLKILEEDAQLHKESEEPIIEASCWHIAKSYAANLVLHKDERVKTLLRQGKDIANQMDSPIWKRAFSRED